MVTSVDAIADALEAVGKPPRCDGVSGRPQAGSTASDRLRYRVPASLSKRRSTFRSSLSRGTTWAVPAIAVHEAAGFICDGNRSFWPSALKARSSSVSIDAQGLMSAGAEDHVGVFGAPPLSRADADRNQVDGAFRGGRGGFSVAHGFAAQVMVHVPAEHHVDVVRVEDGPQTARMRGVVSGAYGGKWTIANFHVAEESAKRASIQAAWVSRGSDMGVKTGRCRIRAVHPFGSIPSGAFRGRPNSSVHPAPSHPDRRGFRARHDGPLPFASRNRKELVPVVAESNATRSPSR